MISRRTYRVLVVEATDAQHLTRWGSSANTAAMNLAIMSDLHNEFDRRGRRCDVPTPPAGHPQLGPDLTSLKGRIDVLLLAGDIDIGRQSVSYCAQAAQFLDAPVVMVAGNHEYYNGVFQNVLASMRDEAEGHANVHFLENDAAELELGTNRRRERLRVLGCSLWTDYALYGSDEVSIARSMGLAAEGLSDHWLITMDDDGTRFSPQQALEEHKRSRAWLKAALARDFDGPTIALTHHGISSRSQPSQFIGSSLGPCFLSDLDQFVEASRVPLWVHGHTHFDVDYRIGRTRVVARQRGYPNEATNFKPLIVEL